MRASIHGAIMSITRSRGSARQLERASFAEEVSGNLKEISVPSSSLVLEVTESFLLGDVKSMLERLEQLTSFGVRLAIDDFGTCYSSLSCLSQLPFDILKIDKSFVDTAGDASGGTQLMPAIIDLGKTLNIQTVAEGIERPEQLRRLRLLQCDLGQGFLFARPVAAEGIDELLRSLVQEQDAA